MWAILKVDKNNLNYLEKDFKKKLGNEINIYSPKLIIQKYKKNKLTSKEFSLLGDYIFCFHKEFENPSMINSLKFSRGLKYFLCGFKQSQKEIQQFVQKCKESEDKNGYLTVNFFKIYSNSLYKFSTGPFADTIFKIISLQKSKINILLGNIKTTICKKRFLFTPL
tara:strand:+ start:53 stop:550 length:498 start_codon:yes stop_codon:yes gene_type:complete